MPRGDGGFKSCKSPPARMVGWGLARECFSTADKVFRCTDVFASKLPPTRFVVAGVNTYICNLGESMLCGGSPGLYDGLRVHAM